MTKKVNGFSRLSKEQKINWLVKTYLNNSQEAKNRLTQYWNSDEKLQKLHDEFIENTLTNFYLPLGIAPNFNINGKMFAIPMVIEESSVIAAASKTSKYWGERGGFKAEVLSTEKVGQVHFTYSGNVAELNKFFASVKPKFFSDSKKITANMKKRGGGILDIELRDKTEALPDYFQLHCTFETLDAMGANFINTCLEQFAATLNREFKTYQTGQNIAGKLEVVMSILSNYVPHCLVKASVSCPVERFTAGNIAPELFAKKFVQAVRIAEAEPYRAVTHNKGIMNGIDAVVLATGNDFRAIEAGIHAYASRDGQYRSLSKAKVVDGVFTFLMTIPLALGTVGGLTKLHPLVKLNMEILGNPTAKELMEIVAVAGLAQNFAAIKALTTTGIQKGHMKMHLMNILNEYQATEAEKTAAIHHFEKNTVSQSAVRELLEGLRK
ncbi:MAG: hydroxymethylglutaryl-CoA reductase, degradative [Leeuwenhoekiella sp.]